MSKIEKLWGHIENMSPDQIRESIRKMRQDRKIRKAPRAVKKAAAARESAVTVVEKTMKKLDKLSPEALERLMKEMGG